MKNKLIIILFLNFLIGQISINSISPTLKSVILPGWGELELKNKKRSNQFFIQEASIWITYIGLNKISSLYKSDYQAFAALHAHTNLAGKSYQYSVDIGDYNTYEEFFEAKKRNRQSNQIWPENDDYDWNWDSENNRKEYDKMRIISGVAKKYSKFAVGAMIVNRVVSMIDVLYLKSLNSRYKIDSSISSFDYNGIKYSINISF